MRQTSLRPGALIFCCDESPRALFADFDIVSHEAVAGLQALTFHHLTHLSLSHENLAPAIRVYVTMHLSTSSEARFGVTRLRRDELCAQATMLAIYRNLAIANNFLSYFLMAVSIRHFRKKRS
jgi:hypothetical protein